MAQAAAQAAAASASQAERDGAAAELAELQEALAEVGSPAGVALHVYSAAAALLPCCCPAAVLLPCWRAVQPSSAVCVLCRVLPGRSMSVWQMLLVPVAPDVMSIEGMPDTQLHCGTAGAGAARRWPGALAAVAGVCSGSAQRAGCCRVWRVL